MTGINVLGARVQDGTVRTVVRSVGELVGYLCGAEDICDDLVHARSQSRSSQMGKAPEGRTAVDISRLWSGQEFVFAFVVFSVYNACSFPRCLLCHAETDRHKVLTICDLCQVS